MGGIRIENRCKTAAAKQWENALSGFDGYIASLEIKEPGSSASASGAPGSGVRAAVQECRKADKPLAPNQKASNRERNGFKPDLLPLSLPITGAGGAPVSHYPPSLKGCSNTKEKVLHFRVHISSSMLAVPALDLGLTVWICDP